MRPRWILQNPRHRQKSEAAMNPVICRWRTENLTWWEASQAPSGETNHCGTYQTVRTQPPRIKQLTEACAVAMEKILSGNQHNRLRLCRRRNIQTSTRFGAVRQLKMTPMKNRSDRFGTFLRHHRRSQKHRKVILKRHSHLQSATARELSHSCCDLRTSAEAHGMAFPTIMAWAIITTTTITTSWRTPSVLCGHIPPRPIFRCSFSHKTTICYRQTVSSNRPWSRWELRH